MRQSIAYVPQRSTVDWDFPASALDVVAMGLYGQIGWFGRVRGHHRERAMACLEQSAWPISPTARSALSLAASSSGFSRVRLGSGRDDLPDG